MSLESSKPPPELSLVEICYMLNAEMDRLEKALEHVYLNMHTFTEEELVRERDAMSFWVQKMNAARDFFDRMLKRLGSGSPAG